MAYAFLTMCQADVVSQRNRSVNSLPDQVWSSCSTN